MSNIIIPKGDSFGKTRSEHEENLRKEWGHTISDEQLDKLKFAEKQKKNFDGSSKNFLTGGEIDNIDSSEGKGKASGRIRVGYIDELGNYVSVGG